MMGSNSIGHSDTLSAVLGALGRAGFALLVIATAIVALFASAMVGILVAFGALALRLANGRGRQGSFGAGRAYPRESRPEGGSASKGQGGAVLEAHQTATGWVVERSAR